MECFFVKNKIGQYVSRRTSDDESEKINSHLRSCESCKSDYSQQKFVLDALSRLPVLTVKEPVLKSLSSKKSAPSNPKEKTHFLPWYVGIATKVIIATLIVFSLIYFPYYRSYLHKNNYVDPVRVAYESLKNWTESIFSSEADSSRILYFSRHHIQANDMKRYLTQTGIKQDTDTRAKLERDTGFMHLDKRMIAMMKYMEKTDHCNPGALDCYLEKYTSPMSTKEKPVVKASKPAKPASKEKKKVALVQDNTTVRKIVTMSPDFDNDGTRIMELIKNFNGVKAGNKDLGSTLKGGWYYHVLIPKERIMQFLSDLKKIIPYNEDISTSDYTVPPEKERLIIWVGKK